MTTMVVTILKFAYDSGWCLDYGATNHVALDIHNLLNKIELTG